MKYSCLSLLFLLSLQSMAQIPEKIFNPQIKSVQLYPVGNQLGNPVLRLGSSEQLELHFDELTTSVKNYSYTFQLCNADWTPAVLSHFDFIKGFSQVRITNYRPSSIALTRYVHYQATLPDKSCVPTKSGNYILKVFLNSDTSKLVFTRKILIVQEKATIAAQVQQPFGSTYKSSQKIQFKVSLNEGLDVMNAQQQVKVTILQNNRWDNAITGLKPTFFARKILEYNTENDAVFAAGKEWRWLDLRSFRLQSDRVESANYTNKGTEIFVRPDVDRSQQRFNFYRDANGKYYIHPSESVNPFWQSDYATTHFTYVPEGNSPYPGKDVYLFGQLTDYNLDDDAKMQFNAERGVYETSVMLKQGYYDYVYVTTDNKDRIKKASFEDTEGDLWESENQYTILVYYRSLAGRYDELIGFSNVNSLAVQ